MKDPRGFIRECVELVRVNLLGWVAVFTRGIQNAARIWARLTLLRAGFMAAGLGLVVLSFFPWVSYEIHFLERTEFIRIGSRMRLLYFLSGLILITTLFLEFRGRIYLASGALALAGLAFVLGLIFPTPLHTAILNRADYSFTPWFYIHGCFLLAALALSWQALRKPVWEYADVLRVLREVPGSRSEEASAESESRVERKKSPSRKSSARKPGAKKSKSKASKAVKKAKTAGRKKTARKTKRK